MPTSTHITKTNKLDILPMLQLCWERRQMSWKQLKYSEMWCNLREIWRSEGLWELFNPWISVKEVEIIYKQEKRENLVSGFQPDIPYSEPHQILSLYLLTAENKTVQKVNLHFVHNQLMPVSTRKTNSLNQKQNNNKKQKST